MKHKVIPERVYINGNFILLKSYKRIVVPLRDNLNHASKVKMRAFKRVGGSK